MEELPQEQNLFPSELQNNNINNMNYSMFEQINHPGLDLDMGASNLNQNLLKSKDNTIKQLKRKIQAYEKNTEVQNQTLSDYDHLLVEFNSLNKNYSQRSSINKPKITAKGTDKTIHQNHKITAHNNAQIRISIEFTQSCFHIRTGTIT